MSVSQLEKAMANLRIGLAEMENKEAQLDAQISQFRQQLRRVPRQAMYGQASLDASLAAMGKSRSAWRTPRPCAADCSR